MITFLQFFADPFSKKNPPHSLHSLLHHSLSLTHILSNVLTHTFSHSLATHSRTFVLSPFLSPRCTPTSVDSLLFQESRLADCKVFSLSPSLFLCLPTSLSVSLSLSLSTLLLPVILTWNSYVCEQSANVTVVANTVTLLVSRSWSEKKESLKHQK